MSFELHHPSWVPWADEILHGSYDHWLDESAGRKYDEPTSCHRFQIPLLHPGVSSSSPATHLTLTENFGLGP